METSMKPKKLKYQEVQTPVVKNQHYVTRTSAINLRFEFFGPGKADFALGGPHIAPYWQNGSASDYRELAELFNEIADVLANQ